MDTRWWETYDNIVTLTAWMADNGYTVQEVAYAVEKPWKYGDEWRRSRIDNDHPVSVNYREFQP